MPCFSIITPTICRRSLVDTLNSVGRQMARYDEHIVVSDGAPDHWVRDEISARARTTLLHTERISGYGNVQRDLGIEAATGDYLIFVDDDDVLVEGALDVIRPLVADSPGSLFLFKTRYEGYNSIPQGEVLWKTPHVYQSNVGTGMIVAPRLLTMPKWSIGDGRLYDADFHFIKAMADMVPVVWRDEIIQWAYHRNH